MKLKKIERHLGKTLLSESKPIHGSKLAHGLPACGFMSRTISKVFSSSWKNVTLDGAISHSSFPKRAGGGFSQSNHKEGSLFHCLLFLRGQFLLSLVEGSEILEIWTMGYFHNCFQFRENLSRVDLS